MPSMRILPWLRIVVAAVLLLGPDAAAARDAAERSYAMARDRYHRNIDHPRENTARNWDRAIALFQDVATRHPRSRWAPDALYSIGLSYEKKGDQSSAASAFEAMAREYPKSRLADDALLLAALKRIQLSAPARGEKNLLQVVRDHPEGDMYENARDRLVELYREWKDAAGARRLRKLIESDSGGGAARRNLALIVEELGGTRPAETSLLLEQRLWGDPDGELSIVGRGEDWLRSQGRPYVKGIRTWSAPRSTRVVIELSSSVPFKHNRLDNPDRIYVDLFDAVAYEQAAELEVDDGLLRLVRASQFDSTTARIVIDPVGETEYSVFELADPSRIVLDLRRPGEPELRYAMPVGTASLAQELGLRVAQIAIDPGHGGRDPGAIGAKGLREKDVTLQVAIELERLLEAEGTFDAFLTRSDDRFVPLEERTAIANQRSADLFLSIHFNAHKDKRRNGYETYYLAMAQDDEARAVAAMENAASMKSLPDLPGLLDGILRTSHRNESRRLASEVQMSMAGEMGGANRGVKRAGFVVLVGADMPAILAECGFITNPREGSKLRDAETVRRIARSLYEGVLAYARGLTILSEH